MKCPICKNKVTMSDPFMPFCSERCKLIDLGNWADGKYVISTPADRVPARSPDDSEDADD